MSNRNSFLSTVNLLTLGPAAPTVTNRDASTPATYAVDGRLKTPLRANAADTQLTFGRDLGAVYPIRCLFAGEVNWPAGSEWRLRLSNASVGGTDVHDTGFVAANVPTDRAQSVMHFAAAFSARYVEIAVRTAGGTGVILEYGWLWLGQADFEPDIGADFRAKFGFQPRDLVQTTEGGVDYHDEKRGFYNWQFAFRQLTHAEAMQQAIGIDANLRTIKPVLFVPYVHSTNLNMETLLGKFASIDLVEIADVVNFAKAYSLRECLSAKVDIAWS